MSINRANLLLTGASGCVGHYITEQLLASESYHIHLFIRPSSRLLWDPSTHEHVTVHYGNMEDLSGLTNLVPQMDYIMHVFTDWSNSPYATFLNVDQTHALFSMADSDRLRRIIYFSTASILDSQHRPLEAAGKWGPGYIRSKYASRLKLDEHPYKDRIITVYPTLVFGGDATHPYSHISQGLPHYLHYMKYLRFIQMNGAFHFLHADDIARTAIHLLTAPHPPAHVVLGTKAIEAKDALAILRDRSGYRSWCQLPLPTRSLLKIAQWCRIEIGDWERYCILNPRFTYDTHQPATFGLTTRFSTLESVIDDRLAQHV
ncbi:NAD(P)-dependent oxidoreductase [bacterium]|nr:NAD(P)-dependent oxidoreductase [bacterium]